VIAKAGRLDVLVNNAGYAMMGAAEETSVEEAKAQFETNFFGIVRMVNAVLPGMRAAGAGKIINISSLAGNTAIPFSAFYSATKFAVEGYSESLWHEVRPFGVSVSLVEPGFVNTPIGEASPIAERSLSAYGVTRKRMLTKFGQSLAGGIPPEQVARSVLQIVESKAPGLRYRVGARATWLPRLRNVVPWKVYAAGVRKTFAV
jgi:short-subunit dehydrogenase